MLRAPSFASLTLSERATRSPPRPAIDPREGSERSLLLLKRTSSTASPSQGLWPWRLWRWVNRGLSNLLLWVCLCACWTSLNAVWRCLLLCSSLTGPDRFGSWLHMCLLCELALNLCSFKCSAAARDYDLCHWEAAVVLCAALDLFSTRKARAKPYIR